MRNHKVQAFVRSATDPVHLNLQKGNFFDHQELQRDPSAQMEEEILHHKMAKG